jgi:hypothetical protein
MLVVHVVDGRRHQGRREWVGGSTELRLPP